MYGLFANSVDSLGTANLSKDLDGVERQLESLDASDAEQEATDLLEQIKDLVAINASLNKLATRERRNPSVYPGSASASDIVHLQSVLDAIAATIKECTVFAKAIQSSLNDIASGRNAVGFVTHETRLKNQSWYDETCQALKLRTEVLKTLCSAVHVLQHKNKTEENGNLSIEARSYATTLGYQIALIDAKLLATEAHTVLTLRSALAAAKAVTIHVPTSANKHFVVARSVRSFFTGRQEQLAKLKAAFDVTNLSQKRFVIYGLSGSGKTELALKYAEEHQDKFWGVFFVDGSSRENAFGSYAEIATIGGVEPNERAAKNWLMTRDLPWLLILDNVDDEEISLNDLLPAGMKGSVLITSQNPGHKSYGNVGSRFLELQIMQKQEANDLILKAAEAPSPWSTSVKESASIICHALGYLPLAIVHAAKAILLGLCSWSDYLTYYDRQTQRIRRERFRRRSQSPSKNRTGFREDNDTMNVFSSYEILYQSLEASPEERFQDAAELLYVFSYFHFQNIRLDFLLSAAINPYKEADQKEKDAKENTLLQNKLPKPKPKPWSVWHRELIFGLRGFLETPPPLPAALKNSENLPQSVFEGEVHIRLSEALAVLLKRSLIMRQDRIESRYSMHPLVHQWIRERPNVGISHQSLWCQVAMTILAKSILRPPLGDTEHDRDMRRELLPHIIHVRECQVVTKMRLEENRALVRPIWPVPNDKFGRFQADESARFSRVYSECGLFNEALKLQYRTLTFLTQVLGENHPLTIRVTLFVSGTLSELTRVAKATRLQRRALQVCVESLGEDHPLTLEVADSLGTALALKGRWAEALAIHESNVSKMRILYGEDHEKTLKSVRNVARLYYRYMEYGKATELHQVAWEGMNRRLPDTHLETLTSLEDLAMSYLRHYAEPVDQVSAERLFESHEMVKFVFEQRRKILGKEQPYTLLSSLYLAQLKSALGQHGEAEKMIRQGLPAAERNLGEEHAAVLAAKASCARLFIQIGRCEEAEEILRGLVRKAKYCEMSDEDGDHPDRIAALWFLTECLEKQERSGEAVEMAKEVVEAMQKIGGRGLGSNHKFIARVQEKIVELEKKNQMQNDNETKMNSNVSCIN